MTLDRLTIGPFAAVYVGRSDDSSVLTRVNTLRQGGGTVKTGTTQNYVDCLDGPIQSGRQVTQINLRFAQTDAKAVCLALGNYLNASNEDQPSDFAQYTIVLLHPDITRRESIYIPKCYTNKELLLNYSKREITGIPILFEGQNRNRFIQRFYKRTRAEIATLLGSRSPF